MRWHTVIGVPAFMMGVLAMAQTTPFSGSWECVRKEAAFSPRDTAEGVVFKDKLWISNAYHHGNILVRDLWNSADGITWEKALEPTPYDGYSEMVVYKDAIWAIKGSVWRSEDGVAWTQILEKTPFGVRGYGECVVFQDKIWQLGSGKEVYWTTDGVEWTCVQPDAPYGPRSACAVAVYKDHLWVIGGFSNRESKNIGESWYTEDGTTWTRFAPEPHWSARHEVTPYVFKKALWVVAGNAWPLVNDVWRLALPEAGTAAP